MAGGDPVGQERQTRAVRRPRRAPVAPRAARDLDGRVGSRGRRGRDRSVGATRHPRRSRAARTRPSTRPERTRARTGVRTSSSRSSVGSWGSRAVLTAGERSPSGVLEDRRRAHHHAVEVDTRTSPSPRRDRWLRRAAVTRLLVLVPVVLAGLARRPGRRLGGDDLERALALRAQRPGRRSRSRSQSAAVGADLLVLDGLGELLLEVLERLAELLGVALAVRVEQFVGASW